MISQSMWFLSGVRRKGVADNKGATETRVPTDIVEYITSQVL